MRELGCNVIISTDDGSKGFKGNAVECFENQIKTNNFDAVYGCGPEMMLYNLAKSCVGKKVECQVSIERYMKCGFGICGSCDMSGKTICIDGPVLNAKDALACDEFGNYHRESSGKKILRN